ncbi:MAG: ferrochelatase [Pseudomonadota bacterium]
MRVDKAIVLVNIGTPEELSVKGVRKYLSKFLMDKNVVDIPYLIRLLLVRGIIVPFRAPKSLEAYEAIWQTDGSPLDIYTQQIVEDLGAAKAGEYRVEYAMSYSSPYIDETLDQLKAEGVKEVYYLPMYPQYAQSSSLSALESGRDWAANNPDVTLKSLTHYFDQPSFLDAAADKIKEQVSGESESYFLYSFHGIPEKHVTKLYAHCQNDGACSMTWSENNKFCYRAQCYNTARVLSEKLGFKNWGVSFQSRLGRAQWILPYTVKKVEELGQEGVKDLVVIPYAFTVDCLETEEEIEQEVRDAFIQAGGERMKRVECLNRDFSKVVTSDFLKAFKPIEQALEDLS